MSTESLFRPLLRESLSRINDLDTQLNLSLTFLESIDTPRSLMVAMLLKAGEYDQIAQMKIDPHNYEDRFRFRDDYHATCFLSKAAWFPRVTDLAEVALDSFRKSEANCSKVNDMFRRYWKDPLFVDPVLRDILFRAAAKISSILGNVPSPRAVNFGFGPGSSSTCGGKKTSSYEKVRAYCETTVNCLPLIPLMGQYPAWLDSQPNPQASDGLPLVCLVPGSKLLFVPKSAKTDRSICIEPHLNGFFQKGFGKYIRQRLLQAGVDLSDQSKNARRARTSSIDGLYATLDLSMASDSIAYNLVLDLLPPDWFRLLDACRSPNATYKDEVFSLEKFSSMGNGYTFELESLLFYSISWAVISKYGYGASSLLVYGDDIVVPTDCYDEVVKVLGQLGFAANHQKSFSDGYFRESCGDHWFCGLNCKPMFFKEGVRNAKDLFKFTNSVRRLAHRNCGYGCDGRYEASWCLSLKILSSVGAKALYGSDGLGDGHLIANWDEARPNRVLHRFGTPMYRIRSVHESSVIYDAHDAVALYAFALYEAGPKDRASNGDIPFRRVTRTSLIWLYYHTWYDLGPWI